MDDTRIITNGMCCKINYDQIIEACDGENYTMSLTGSDAEVVAKAVNIGIDSRLQACSIAGKDDFHRGSRDIGGVPVTSTLECDLTPESLCVLIRRLYEDMEYTGDDGDDADVGHSLAEGILMTLGFDDCGKFVGREALGL